MNRNGSASKSEVIRQALRVAGRPLILEELQPEVEERMQQIIGRKKLYTLLAMMQTKGVIVTSGREDARTYALAKR